MNKFKPMIILSLLALSGCSGKAPDLGIKDGKLLLCSGKPNCVSSQALDEDHYITPLSFTGSQEQAKGRLLKILADDKKAKVLIEQGDYIRAEFTSSIFRFVDDVEFYFPPQASSPIKIQVRSASRIGYSDLGANRKRIEQIRKLF